MSQIKRKNIQKSQKKITKSPHNFNEMMEMQKSAGTRASSGLNNIVQVTEQHDTNRYNTQSLEQVSEFIKKAKKSWRQKTVECLKYLFPCFGQEAQFSITVKEQQLLKTIQKLRAQKLTTKPFLPPLLSNKKTLVLDIDQTLVFSSQNQLEKYDFTFTMPYKKGNLRVYTKNRFGLESFLFEMSKIYQIIVYTTNIRQYADNVLKNIDKKKRISHILYKQKCLNLNKIHYLKSLKALGRSLDQTIFIDHNIASGILQPRNFLHIKPFTGEKHDRQLVKLIPFLRELSLKDSVTPVNSHFEQYCNREIRLKFNSIDHTYQQNNDDKQNEFEEKRKCYEPRSSKTKKTHRKIISELKPLTKQAYEEDSNKQMEINTAQTQIVLQRKDMNYIAQ